MVQLSNEKMGPWLFKVFFLGEILPMFSGDYNKPLEGSLLNNQHNDILHLHPSDQLVWYFLPTNLRF